MNKPYSPPTVENWVTKKFIKANIIFPSDLKLGQIAQAFGVDYSSWHGKAYSYKAPDGSGVYIVSNRFESIIQQRKYFFHELGHILRHCGDQRKMNESFRMMQEADANLFSMYASIPFHMINFERGYTLHSIMEEFQVSKELALKRIEDIRQKTFWEHKRRRENPKPILHPFNLKNCTDETKRIMAQLSKQTGVRFL